MLENHLNVIKLDIAKILYKTNYGLWSFQAGGTKSNILNRISINFRELQLNFEDEN